MTKADDLIAALNQRRLLKTGEDAAVRRGLPDAWQQWLASVAPKPERRARADVAAWLAHLLPRPLRAPEGSKGLEPPFSRLLRLSRPPDPREERPLRIGATTADILLHLILAALLLWLMYLQLFAVPEMEDDGGGDVVQVEFIGRGNAQAGGGALATEGAEAAPAAASAARRGPSNAAAAAASNSARPSPAPTPAPAPAVAASAASTAPKPETVAPPAEAVPEQPLQVSSVPQPTPEAFRLPPPREARVQLRQPRLEQPQLEAKVESLVILQAQPVRTLQPQRRQPQLREQELREAVRAIDATSPDTRVISRTLSVPAPAQAQLQVPQLTGELRGIPLRDAGSGSSTAASGSGLAAAGNAAEQGAGGNATRAGGQGQARAGTGHGAAPGANGGRGASATGAGAGPALRAAPGGWPGAARSDDWGASNRNAPGTGSGTGSGRGTGRGEGGGRGSGQGGGSGLFGDDGRARLPDQWSENSNLDLDLSGSWLKRPGLEYRGTRFDKYWIPSGTLLQEWVRRGIRELSIPIPGSSMRLRCVVSLLQLGGGCLPVDPNVNEQPATGRPAPDIPFKPELQEDNGSLPPPPKPAAAPTTPARGTATTPPTP